MFGLLLRIIHFLKLENFENLSKIINNDEHFECWQGSVFSDEDSVVREKILNHKFFGEKLQLVPYSVTNAVLSLTWQILSILINLSTSAELPTNVLKKMLRGCYVLACSKRLFSKIQRDLNAVMKEFSRSHNLFSEVLSRLVWRNLKWKEGEKERLLI